MIFKQSSVNLRVAITLVVTGVLAGSGCGTEELSLPITTASLEQSDSAGISIRQTSEGVLRTSLPWLIDATPELEIGLSIEDDSYQFSRISGLVALADGEIVVVDEGSRNIRWFDAQGRFLRSLGEAGQGPADFVQPRLVSQFQGDSLLVFDARLRRFTAVALDGQWVRTRSAPGHVTPLLSGRPSVAHGDRVLFRSGSGGCPSADTGVCELRQVVHAVDPVGGTTDTLLTTAVRLFQPTSLMILDIPLEPSVSAAVGREGFLLTMGERFEIREYDGEGRLHGIIRVDHPPVPLGEDELERMILDYPRGGLDESDVRRMFGEMEIRSTKPTFSALLVDSLGWIWAKRFRITEDVPSEWLVFDPLGQGRGVLELPRGLDVHEIGEDFVLGVGRDALGVQYVLRYGLERVDP